MVHKFQNMNEEHIEIEMKIEIEIEMEMEMEIKCWWFASLEDRPESERRQNCNDRRGDGADSTATTFRPGT